MSAQLPDSIVTAARARLEEHDRATGRTDGSGESADTDTGRALWVPESLADLAADPPPAGRFLLRRLWPADAYGVIAAAAKAGKTWLALDVALAVACGHDALGSVPVDQPGRVLVFLGEGGRRNAWRRLSAVAEHYGTDPAGVDDLHLIYRSPKVTDADAYAEVVALVAELAPVLVIVDPLYLAVSGSDGASLYGMGTVLERVQHLADAAGSALIVVHHWNQTGKGSGAGRMSGAGPEEWGRVLWSVAAESVATDRPHGSAVALTVRVSGGEVPDSAFTLIREVWADDPDSLASPLHYNVTPGGYVNADAGGRKLNRSDRALAVLEAAAGEWMTPAEVQDADAEWSHTEPDYHPLKLETVRKSLAELHDAGRIARDGPGGAVGYRYRIPDGAP